MRDHSCPIGTMTIEFGSPLDVNSVRPKPIKDNGDGTFDVEVDPVSLAFMMTSVGSYTPVGYAVEQLNEILDAQEAKTGGSSE